MAIKKYKIKSEIDLHKFANYSVIAKAIRKIIPGEDFNIHEKIMGGYIKDKIKKLQLEIDIIVPDYKENHKEEFEKIKAKLEEILETEVTDIIEKY